MGSRQIQRYKTQNTYSFNGNLYHSFTDPSPISFPAPDSSRLSESRRYSGSCCISAHGLHSPPAAHDSNLPQINPWARVFKRIVDKFDIYPKLSHSPPPLRRPASAFQSHAASFSFAVSPSISGELSTATFRNGSLSPERCFACPSIMLWLRFRG